MMYTSEVEPHFYVWENDIDTRIIEIDEKLREVLLTASSEVLANVRASLDDVEAYAVAYIPDPIKRILPLTAFLINSLDEDKDYIESYMIALTKMIREEIDEILMDRMILEIYD